MTASSKASSSRSKAPAKASNKPKKAPVRQSKASKPKANDNPNTPKYGVWPD